MSPCQNEGFLSPVLGTLATFFLIKECLKQKHASLLLTGSCTCNRGNERASRKHAAILWPRWNAYRVLTLTWSLPVHLFACNYTLKLDPFFPDMQGRKWGSPNLYFIRCKAGSINGRCFGLHHVETSSKNIGCLKLYDLARKIVVDLC